MNPGDPLAQLRDIHLPAAVSWWPPAPGWWLLLVLLLLGLAALLWLAIRHWRRRAYRRIARRELQACFADWQQSGDNRGYLEAVNAILKRTALRSFPRREVAALYGESWCNFLDGQIRRAAAPPLSQSVLARNYYAPDVPAGEDLEALQHSALHWLRHHRSRSC